MAKKSNILLDDEQILSMQRKTIRYALYRCKGSISAPAHPTKEHTAILSYYEPQLEEFGFDISDFADERGWDVSKKDVTEIVTGKTLRKYIEELHAPLV